MTLDGVLLVASALFAIGLYGAISQQSFVMLMMGLELMINGAILAGMGLWRTSAAGNPKGSLMIIVFMTVMAVELSVGFAVIFNVYRIRKADITEKLKKLKG